MSSPRNSQAIAAGVIFLLTAALAEASAAVGAGSAVIRLTIYLGGFLVLFYSLRRLQSAGDPVTTAPARCAQPPALDPESPQPARAVVVLDADKHVIRVNEAFTELTGYGEQEILGKRPGFLDLDRGVGSSFEAAWESLDNCREWRGEVWDRRKDGQAYLARILLMSIGRPSHDKDCYVVLIGDAAQVSQCEDDASYLAQHDALTGLPNRVLCNDRLGHAVERARRSGNQVAVIFIDLDGFKHINDTLGHAAGDRLLQGVAKRLTEQTRKGDTVCRLGGDEFTIVMEGFRDSKQPAVVAQKVLECFKEPFKFEGHDLHTSPSMGIAVFPDDGWDTETLVRNADAAMYQAKNAGKNNYQFYSEELTAQALERFLLDSNLREAVSRGQLELDYQPQVTLLTGDVIGAEALLRWNHPELGRLAPPRFLKVAEETGVIEQIGAWVLATVCSQAAAWRESGLTFERVSVNLSALQFRRGDLVATVQQVLGDAGLPANLLELEFNERVLLQHGQQAVDILIQLNQLGVGLAIDNFGSGYSSLDVLKRLPLDRLKIDMSFIRDVPQSEEDVAIVQTVIALGHRLGLAAIAEGVERPEQQAFLRSEDCDEAQGYLYGGPVSAEKFAKLLPRNVDR